MEAFSWVIALIGFFYAIQQKRWAHPPLYILVGIIGYIAACFISHIANELPLSEAYLILKSNRWVFLYLGYIQLIRHKLSSVDISKSVQVLKLTLLLTCLYAFFQSIYAVDFFRSDALFHELYSGSTHKRPNGFFNLPTTFAYSMTMLFCITLSDTCIFLSTRGLKEKVRDITVTLFSLSAIILSFTRAAWICLTISTLTIIGISRKSALKLAILMLIIFTTSLYSTNYNFRSRLNSIFNSQYEGNYHRIGLWTAYYNMFSSNYLVGVGHDRSLDRLDKYLEKKERKYLFSHPHNSYIKTLAELGLLGFFFFTLFLLGNFYLNSKLIRRYLTSGQKTQLSLTIGCLGLQIVFWVGALTECNFKDSELLHSYTFFIALLSGFEARDQDQLLLK